MPKRSIFKEHTVNPQVQKSVPQDQSTAHLTEFVIGRAIEVFANQQKALRWLGTPIRALEYATPISLLGHPEGRHAVLTVLDKIEHGVL